MYSKLRCKVSCSTPYVYRQTSGFTYRAHTDLDSRHQIYRTAYGVVKGGGNPVDTYSIHLAPRTRPRLRNVNELMEIMHGLVLLVCHKCGHLRFSNIICLTEIKAMLLGEVFLPETDLNVDLGLTSLLGTKMI
jgi:hypothetical protein